MNTLDKLEKRFGGWAVPNVMLYLITAQVLVYALVFGGVLSFSTMPLVPAAVIHDHQYWRLITFMIAPPSMASGFGLLFLALFWYILWMIGGAVEAVWGSFRFNVYLLLGIILTIVGAFTGQVIAPGSLVVIFPDFLYLSIFFAFAVLNPNFEFYILFVLPVKVKWLAMLSAVWLGIQFLGAPNWGMRLATLAPVLNFLLFFRDAFVHSVRAGRRRQQFQAKAREVAAEALHTCILCGATEKSHPERDFRYRMVEGEHVAVCSECRERGDS